jgi:hypothetical protein
MSPSRLAVLLFGVSGMTGSTLARAQPPDRVATADALFEQARALVERGDIASACPLFKESQRLDPGVGTMLWLADCYASSGQTASAWVAFKEAAAAAARTHDRRLGVAVDKVDELEKKLSRLEIVVPLEVAVEGLELRRDGVRLERTEWSLAVPLDPGVHALSGSAPGRKPWSASVTLAPGPTSLSVTVPVLEAVPDAEPPASALDTTVVAKAPTEGHEGIGGQRWIGLASMGVGAVGLIVGTVWSLEAKSTYDQSTMGPCTANNICTPAGLDERSSAQTLATEATVAMAVGALAVVGGAIVFFTAPKRAGAVVVAPAWANGGSVTISGAF